jgi:hypothetical protein
LVHKGSFMWRSYWILIWVYWTSLSSNTHHMCRMGSRRQRVWSLFKGKKKVDHNDPSNSQVRHLKNDRLIRTWKEKTLLPRSVLHSSSWHSSQHVYYIQGLLFSISQFPKFGEFFQKFSKYFPTYTIPTPLPIPPKKKRKIQKKSVPTIWKFAKKQKQKQNVDCILFLFLNTQMVACILLRGCDLCVV